MTRHVRNAFAEGELDPERTCAKSARVQTEGGRKVSRDLDHYNLDVIISVGYRVKSLRGTQFRIWTTRTPPGMAAFAGAFRPTRLLLVGGDGIGVEEFLSQPVEH